MNDKVTQLKPKQKRPEYHIIRSMYAESIVSTYDIETARIIRDQLEDTYTKWWSETFGTEQKVKRYRIELT